MHKIFAVNLKMNLSLEAMKEYLDVLNTSSLDAKIILFPSSLHLSLCKDSSYPFGAQNMFYENKGAYTGEISPLQIKEVGASYVLIGHSERRNYFYEDKIMINKKILSAQNNDLKPIVCIGESIEAYNDKKTFLVLQKQIQDALKDVNSEEELIIAYEPIWAIGSGLTPTINEIDKAAEDIRKICNDFGYFKIKVLYGGSVNLNNIKEIMATDVDGVLVASAANNPNDLIKMINLSN